MALLMACFVVGIGQIGSSWVVLAIQIAVGGMIYLLLVWRFDRVMLLDLIGLALGQHHRITKKAAAYL